MGTQYFCEFVPRLLFLTLQRQARGSLPSPDTTVVLIPCHVKLIRLQWHLESLWLVRVAWRAAGHGLLGCFCLPLVRDQYSKTVWRTIYYFTILFKSFKSFFSYPSHVLVHSGSTLPMYVCPSSAKQTGCVMASGRPWERRWYVSLDSSVWTTSALTPLMAREGEQEAVPEAIK